MTTTTTTNAVIMVEWDEIQDVDQELIAGNVVDSAGSSESGEATGNLFDNTTEEIDDSSSDAGNGSPVIQVGGVTTQQIDVLEDAESTVVFQEESKDEWSRSTGMPLATEQPTLLATLGHTSGVSFGDESVAPAPSQEASLLSISAHPETTTTIPTATVSQQTTIIETYDETLEESTSQSQNTDHPTAAETQQVSIGGSPADTAVDTQSTMNPTLTETDTQNTVNPTLIGTDASSQYEVQRESQSTISPAETTTQQATLDGTEANTQSEVTSLSSIVPVWETTSYNGFLGS